MEGWGERQTGSEKKVSMSLGKGQGKGRAGVTQLREDRGSLRAPQGTVPGAAPISSQLPMLCGQRSVPKLLQRPGGGWRNCTGLKMQDLCSDLDSNL